jgi:hypothetical protein
VGPRAWKPELELDGALERGQLDFAITLAEEVAEESQVDLRTALRFLPLVAAQRATDYDRWAIEWLVRSVIETGGRTIDQAAEVAATLADLPAEPGALKALEGFARGA